MPAAIILTDEEEKEICDLYKSGLGFRKIWKDYGYTQSVATRTLIKHGVPIRDRLKAGAEAREKAKAEHKFIPREKEKIIEDANKESIDCDKQGKRCIYKVKISGGDWVCNYLCSVGHSRGCDAHQCTKYILEKRGRKSGKTEKQSGTA